MRSTSRSVRGESVGSRVGSPHPCRGAVLLAVLFEVAFARGAPLFGGPALHARHRALDALLALRELLAARLLLLDALHLPAHLLVRSRDLVGIHARPSRGVALVRSRRRFGQNRESAAAWTRGSRPEKGEGYSEEARKRISDHVKEHRHEGMPPDRAVAAAMGEVRREGLKVPEEGRS